MSWFQVKVIVSWCDDSMSIHDVNSERNEGNVAMMEQCIYYTFIELYWVPWRFSVIGVRDMIATCYWQCFEPDAQLLSLDRKRHPCSLAVILTGCSLIFSHGYMWSLSLQQNPLPWLLILVVKQEGNLLDMLKIYWKKQKQQKQSEFQKLKQNRPLYEELSQSFIFLFLILDLFQTGHSCFKFQMQTMFFNAHSAVDRTSWGICPVYSQWRPCGCDIWCVGTEGVEVLVRVFITFVSYAQVDEYLFLVLFTEGTVFLVLLFLFSLASAASNLDSHLYHIFNAHCISNTCFFVHTIRDSVLRTII